MRIVKTTCFLLLIAYVCSAQTQSQLPQPGAAKPFRVPAKQSAKLANGLEITLVPYGSIPKAQVTVAVRAGSLNEGASQVWLSDLTGDLLQEGTKKKTAEEVDQAFARLGGRLTVTTTADQTLLTADVLSENAPAAAELLAEVLTTPRLPESELPRLKNDLLRQLAIAKTQPQQMALERFRKVLYGDHPYGRIFPTEAMIQSYSVLDVVRFYNENFGAARTHVFVAGKFEPAQVSAAIKRGFSVWPKGPAPLINIPKPAAKRSLELVEKPEAVQSTLYIGLPALDPTNPDYVATVVMNAMLGGSFISRITQNIRENKGYTYSPNSQISTRYRDGYWLQVADVTTAVTGASLKEIFGEIDKIRSEPAPAAELQRIQRYLSGIFVLQNSSRGGLINQLNFVSLHGLGDEYLSTYVQKVNAVTAADLKRVADKYIAPDRMTIVVVGDKAKISEQIAPYEKAEVRAPAQ
jgi:zinc protease